MDETIKRSDSKPKPSKRAEKLWKEFVTGMGMIGNISNKNGTFYAGTGQTDIDTALAFYARYLILVRKVKPSVVEKLYLGALVPNRRMDRKVNGSKIARKEIDDYKKTHVKRERVLLSHNRAIELMQRISDFVMGDPCKRKKDSEIDLNDLKHYFVLVCKATFGTREASLLPPKPKAGARRKTHGSYMVIGRDLLVGNKVVKLSCHTKQTRLAGSLTPEIKVFPRPGEPFETLQFVGPFWTGIKLERLINDNEKWTYLTRELHSGFRSRTMDDRDLYEWLKKLQRRSPIIKEIAEDSGSGFMLNPASLRSQFFTLFDNIARSPKELQSLTGHRSITTALASYVKVPRDRKMELKEQIMRAWNTGPWVWVTPLW